MGGLGSTRWLDHTRKVIVEECRSLDVTGLSLTPQTSGVLTWASYGGVETSVNYTLLMETLQLTYILEDEVSVSVRLQRTLPFYGGQRIWFTCPLKFCGRRVRTLHLPPGGRFFGCRVCYGLTYRSSQAAHRYDKVYEILAGKVGRSVASVKEEMKNWSPMDMVGAMLVAEGRR